MELTRFFDPQFLINTFGLIGVIAIVFAESGLFFGFFFPGDSLLFTAGLLASQGFLNPTVLFLGVISAAILGDNVGYAFGKKVGPAIFTKDDSLFFSKKHVEEAHAFYQRHGNKTIVFARFVPIVRTFAPIVAGVVNMDYKNFFVFNCLGGVLWSVLFLGLGLTLGKTVPDIEKYILPIVLGIIFFSVLPGIWHFLKKKFLVKK
jgi:membrane-associated protein